MKGFLEFVAIAGTLIAAPVALAAEAWVEVSIDASGDRILVDRSSIQQTGSEVQYWEYQDKRNSVQPVTDVTSSQPVYGMMIYRKVDCAAGSSQVQRLVLFNQNQQVIRRINYTDNGFSQSMVSSSTEAAIRYVCSQQP